MTRRLVTAVLKPAKLFGLVLVILMFSAAAYERIGAWRDGRVLTQMGTSVDIGGRSLNINCRGQGRPTVVFAGGRTSPGYAWALVQRGAAEFTAACWYDRAGLGWSDPGPDPGWGDAAARDLHELLTRADVEMPVVLVGHSFGGYVSRLYHDAYPGEVAGMVLVDAAHEDAGTIEGIPHRERPPLPRWAIRGLAMTMSQFGAMRFIEGEQGPAPAGWTSEEWDVLVRLRRKRDRFVADAQVGPESATAELVRSAGGLEDLPLIVLAQGQLEASVQTGWAGLQQGLARRSNIGRLIVVANSGHGIPLEAPDAVVAAVRDMVSELRGGAGPR